MVELLVLKWGRGDDVGEVFAAMTSHDVVVESACSRAPARPFILSGIRPVLCFGGLGRRERSKIWRERSSFNKDFGGKELSLWRERSLPPEFWLLAGKVKSREKEK